jgi:hypothetical protein
VQNKLFDHRAVTLSFKKKVKNSTISYISSMTTKHPLTALIVDCVYLECH